MRRGRRPWVAAWLVVVLTAAGCSGDGGGLGDTTGTTSGPPLTPVAADVLGRRDAPPEAVAALLEYSGFGEGPGCPPPGTILAVGAYAYPPNTDPGFALDGYTGSQVGDDFTLCAEGMVDGLPVAFDVLDPSGSSVFVESADAYDDGSASVTFRTRVGTPPGVYSVSAGQGSRGQAAATFTVARATSPRLRLEPRQAYPVPPGGAVRFGLAGYPVRATVALAVYVSEDRPLFQVNQFRTVIEPRTDANGEAYVELAIPGDATFGRVLVQTSTLPDDNALHPDRLQFTVGG